VGTAVHHREFVAARCLDVVPFQATIGGIIASAFAGLHRGDRGQRRRRPGSGNILKNNDSPAGRYAQRGGWIIITIFGCPPGPRTHPSHPHGGRSLSDTGLEVHFSFEGCSSTRIIPPAGPPRRAFLSRPHCFPVFASFRSSRGERPDKFPVRDASSNETVQARRPNFSVFPRWPRFRATALPAAPACPVAAGSLAGLLAACCARPRSCSFVSFSSRRFPSVTPVRGYGFFF